MWPAFWRFFWTAQLIAGLANGVRGIVFAWNDPDVSGLEMPLFFLLGFVLPAPLVALVVGGKVLLDKHFPRKQPVRTNALGAVLIGLGICALMIVLAFIAR